MIRPWDPSWIANNEEQKRRRNEEGWKGRANWLDRKNLIEIWMNMFDGNVNELNKILVEKGFDPVEIK